MRLGVIAAERIGTIHKPDVPKLATTTISARRAVFQATQHDAPTAVEHALATPAIANGWAPSGERGGVA